MPAGLLETIYSSEDDAKRSTIANATPGPWTVGGGEVYQGSGHGAKALLRLADGGNPADLVFAACARQDVARLEQTARHLRQVSSGLVTVIEIEHATIEKLRVQVVELQLHAGAMSEMLVRRAATIKGFQNAWFRRAWRWLKAVERIEGD